MKINLFWEHNGDDTLLWCTDYLGAFTRGNSLAAALGKMPAELRSFLAFCGKEVMENFSFEIAEEKQSDLKICDADSDAIFQCEKLPLSVDDYTELKRLALLSAKKFLCLYNYVPNKDAISLPERKTFYGAVPRTAKEMYEHTKNVNNYYFGEIGVECDNDGDIYDCRKRGFELLENQRDFLKNNVVVGSYDEEWSLKKLLRRFIWHDRIHAKAMYRMAIKTFGIGSVPDLFCFDKC